MTNGVDTGTASAAAAQRALAVTSSMMASGYTLTVTGVAVSLAGTAVTVSR